MTKAPPPLGQAAPFRFYGNSPETFRDRSSPRFTSVGLACVG